MKKYLIFVLTIFMLIATPLTAFAAEKGEEGTCNVTFFITDESGSYPGSSFTAVMTDETGTITDSYKFAKGGSWGGNNTPKYTVLAPTTYTVTFEGLEDGYTIVNTLDYSENISFEAADGGVVDCYWSIIEITTTAGTNEENGIESELLKQEESGTYIVSDEEAEKVYKTFLDTVGYIADSEDWYNALLRNYYWFDSEYSGWYAEYVEGGTEEDFLSMSYFDRFVWTETYLRYAWAVNTGNYSNYFGSEENFKTHITNNITVMIENAPDYKAVEDAYLALAKWQYNYVLANGYPYNFINGQTYLDEVGEVPETISTEEAVEQEQKELDEAAAELLEGLDEEDIQKLTEDTENNSSGSYGIIIAIVLILLAAVGAFVILRRRKK